MSTRLLGASALALFLSACGGGGEVPQVSCQLTGNTVNCGPGYTEPIGTDTPGVPDDGSNGGAPGGAPADEPDPDPDPQPDLLQPDPEPSPPSSGGGSGGDSGGGATPPDPEPPATDIPDFFVDPAQTLAPPNESIITGPVELTVFGYGIENAELLPAEGNGDLFPNGGYWPKLAVLTPSDDGTRASGIFDPRYLPNQLVYNLRIEAFDAPAGDSGARAAVAMERSWGIDHGYDWRAGDRFIVEDWQHIYPLHTDTEFLKLWLSVPDEDHEALFAEDSNWEGFLVGMQRYIPHHVALTQGGMVFTGSRSACIYQESVPACREYIQLLLQTIESR